MASPSPYDLFISYAQEDSEWVEGYLLDLLQTSGLRIITEAAFVLGAPRLAEFERAVTTSERTLLVLSPAYLSDNSQQFIEILGQTRDLETGSWHVIPLVLRPVDLPLRLRSLVALSATTPEEQAAAMARLLGALEKQPPPEPEQLACPYPGMVPFSEQDGDRFFGRETEIEEAVQQLRLSPFLAVIGSSGAGKSSLVFAGVLPALRQAAWFRSENWEVATMRPGAQPATTLAALFPDETPADQRCLLVVDQFEEVYTLGQGEADAFQNMLLNRLDAGQTAILLTVRADFYPELMASPLWPRIRAHRLEVAPLDARELRKAITLPAQAVDVFLEAALVERLIHDAASEPGALPLIQETLVLLWEKLERRYLPLHAYEQLSSETNQTGLQVAIARRANAALAELSTEEQRVARRMFLRLIQFGEGRADTRRQQSIQALQDPEDPPALLQGVADGLVARRLLTTSGAETGEPKLDIAHEALIEGWPQLREWLAARREAELTRRRLEGKAAEWDRLGRGTGGLLDAYEMREAVTWLESTDAVELGSSQALKDLAAHSLAALEKSRRTRRITFFAIGALLVGIFLTIILSQGAVAREQQIAQETSQSQIIALETANALAETNLNRASTAIVEAEANRIEADVQRQEALAQARTARSRELAAESLTRRSNFLDASLLLAIEAFRMQDTYQARNVLLAGISAYPGLQQLLFNPDLVDEYSTLYDFQFSPDGSLLAYGLEEKTIFVDVETGRTAASLPEAGSKILFHPEGQRVLLVNPQQAISFWEIQSARLLWSMEDGSNWIDWTPDGSALALILCEDGRQGDCSVEHMVRLSVDSGREISVDSSLRGRNLRQFQIGSNGMPMIVECTRFENQICREGQILEEMVQGSIITRSLPIEAVPTTGYGFSGLDAEWDRAIYLASDPPRRLVLRDLNTDAILNEIQPRVDLGEMGVQAIGWTADLGKVFLTGSDGSLYAWDTASGDLLAQDMAGLYGLPIYGLRVSPDGVTLALNRPTPAWMGFSTEKVALYSIKPQALQTSLVGHDAVVASLAVHPVTGVLASGDYAGEIRFWNLGTDPGPLEQTLAMTGAVTALLYTPDGRYLAGADETGLVVFWDADSLEEIRRFSTALRSMVQLAANPGGRYLAAVAESGRDGYYVSWDLSTLEISEQRVEIPRYIRPLGLAFNEDGDRLYMADYSGWLSYLSFPELKILLEPLTESQSVTSVLYDRFRGNVLAAVSSRVGIFNPDTGQEIGRPIEHELSFIVLALSPDGETVAAMMGDNPNDASGPVMLWDLDTRQPVGSLGWPRVDTFGFPRITYSLDGQFVIVSNWDDGYIRMFNTDPEAWVATACRAAGRNLTQSEWATYFTDEPYRATCEIWPEGE